MAVSGLVSRISLGEKTFPFSHGLKSCYQSLPKSNGACYNHVPRRHGRFYFAALRK